jgi:hypothetical protein
MRIRYACCLALCVCTPAFLAADIPEVPAWPRSIEMAGWHAEAVAVAVAEFRKHQGTKTPQGLPAYRDLRHYSVALSRTPKDQIPLRYVNEQCVRVTFGPELSARDKREATVGGRTDYWIEVSYDILKRNMKLLRQASHAKRISNQSLEPTAGRRTEKLKDEL